MSYINKIKIEGVSGYINDDINIDQFKFTGINSWNDNQRDDNNNISVVTNLDINKIQYKRNHDNPC